MLSSSLWRPGALIRLSPLALAAVLVVGCSDDGQSPGDQGLADGPAALDGGSPDSTPGDGSADQGTDQSTDPCPRTPGPADAQRFVVVSHPFLGAGKKGPDFEVLALSAQGALSATNETFQLGVATDGEIHFTPDGKVGGVVVEGGKIGVFTLDAQGKATVVHAGFDGTFYAGKLLMGDKGKKLYVLDSNWRNNGGGIYTLSIGCDGTLKEEGKLVAAKLPYAATFVDDQRLLLAARDVGSSQAGHDAHLVELGQGAVQSGTDAFGDDEAIVSNVALTHDGRYGLLSDNSAYSRTGGDRVAVVSLDTQSGALSPVQILPNLKDPVWIVTSPHDNAALVLGAQADSVWVLNYDPSSRTPFTLRGKLAATSATLLPGVAVMIRRGSLEGRVLISENTQLRQVHFAKDGSVKEIAVHSFGTGVKAIPGALGVTP